MANEFDNLKGFGAPTTEEVPVEAKQENDSAFKAAAAKVVQMIENDADYRQTRFSRSNDIVVKKILGFSDSGTMVDTTQATIKASIDAQTLKVLPADSPEDGFAKFSKETQLLTGTVKPAKGGKKASYEPPKMEGNKVFRHVSPEARNVGFIIENVSGTPIPYKTAVWTQSPEGKFVPEEVEATMAPGQSVQIDKRYFVMLVSRPEFSLEVQNGKFSVKKVLNSSGNSADLLAALDKAIWIFKKSAGVDINSPEMKILIHEKYEVNGVKKYRVLPEYQEVFGYLNNVTEKVPGTPGRKASTTKKTEVKPSEVEAELLRKALGL